MTDLQPSERAMLELLERHHGETLAAQARYERDRRALMLLTVATSVLVALVG